jgi:hypothetical protein
VLRRLGCSAEDLIKTNVTLSDFNGQASEAQGVLNVDLTIGSKTVLILVHLAPLMPFCLTSFFKTP